MDGGDVAIETWAGGFYAVHAMMSAWDVMSPTGIRIGRLYRDNGAEFYGCWVVWADGNRAAKEKLFPDATTVPDAARYVVDQWLTTCLGRGVG